MKKTFIYAFIASGSFYPLWAERNGCRIRGWNTHKWLDFQVFSDRDYQRSVGPRLANTFHVHKINVGS